jgi:hypothetical protein
MAYTVDAMISVLQKVNALPHDRVLSYKSVLAMFNTQDERDCYLVAKRHEYVKPDIGGNLWGGLTPAGQAKLDGLINAKKHETQQDNLHDQQIRLIDIEAEKLQTEIEDLKINRRRDQREFWTLIIAGAAFVVSIVAVYISVVALIAR